MKSLQDITLNLWQFDTCPVSVIKSRFCHLCFLTLEIRRDATNKDYSLSIPRLFHSLCHSGRSVTLKIHGKGCPTVELQIVHLDVVALPFLHLDFFLSVAHAISFPSVYQRITVDNDTQPIIVPYHEIQLFRSFCHITSLKLCREMCEFHSRFKHSVSTIVQLNRSVIMCHHRRFSLHLNIVPVAHLHTLLTVSTDHAVEDTVPLLHPCDIASFEIRPFAHLLLDTFECCYCMRRLTEIDAPHHYGVGSIRSHHDDFLIPL